MSKNEVNKLQKDINKYADDNDTDILAYFGNITKNYTDELIGICRKGNLRKNVILFITTRGGDPNAGYRFARCLQEAYHTKKQNNLSTGKEEINKGKFSILIDSLCKSAGTLICLGADEIIISGNGELGPIDMQLQKKDEVGESESGLTPLQALNFLERQSLSFFKRHFIELRFSEISFSTKMAAKLASELTTGLLSQVYAQIDPIKLAEVERSMRIAAEYGERLDNGNLKDNALIKLLTSYPSHSFVIDRNEVKKLFKNVIHPDAGLREIADAYKEIAIQCLEKHNIFLQFISSEKQIEMKEVKNDK